MAVLSYYAISIPMEYLIALHWGYGLIGLWYGQVCGSIFHVLSTYYLACFHYDWIEVAREAKERNDLEEKRLHSSQS